MSDALATGGGPDALATVTLAGVTKTYGRHRAVSDVALALRPGECVALAGHNGAGKSTLIKLMLGLIRPTHGRVSVLGEDPAAGAAARARREVGYLPEVIAFHPSMTGAETLAFYARLKRLPIARNAELLERVGIAKAASQRVGTYSKGMRQRLGLAQALLGAPKVLLLDEPTTGLDPALRQGFYEIVRELRRDGATILLSSHALAEIEGHVDRIVILNSGRKVADGTMSELRRAAGVPTRIRVRLAALRLVVNGGSEALGGWSQIGERRFELSCREEDKVAAIQELGAMRTPIEEIEVLQPSLDDLYAHYLKREE
jgi:Cu-processing system ATP-binding protein